MKDGLAAYYGAKPGKPKRPNPFAGKETHTEERAERKGGLSQRARMALMMAKKGRK